MWPLEPRRSVVLRIGRERVELWHGETEDRFRSAPIERPLDGPALQVAIAQVLQAQEAIPGRVELVVESAWAPVLALPGGTWRWGLRTQLSALLRHRLEVLYSDATDPVGAWTLRVDYRPGDAHAIGYAVSPKVRAAVEQAVHTCGSSLAALQPAFDWGRTGRRAMPHSGWWLWLEQDRTIVARLSRGSVTALHPAAPALVAGLDVQRLVQIESMRFGIEPSEPVVVSGWQVPVALPPGITWVSATTGRADRAAGKPAEVAI